MAKKDGFKKEDYVTEYEYYRTKAGYSREKASELLSTSENFISPDLLYRVEHGEQTPSPSLVIRMAEIYKRPEICNYHCSKKCAIGLNHVPQVDVNDLANIVLQAVASLNEAHPLINRLIQIAVDGKITDDEIKDFAYIQHKLEEVSLASDVLNLWIERTIHESGLNKDLYNEECKKLID